MSKFHNTGNYNSFCYRRTKHSVWHKGLCNNYLVGGGGVGWETRGDWHSGKSQLERGLDVEFNTYSGRGLTFSLFFKHWKSGRRAIRVQIFILAYTEIKLEKYQLQAF